MLSVISWYWPVADLLVLMQMFGNTGQVFWVTWLFMETIIEYRLGKNVAESETDWDLQKVVDPEDCNLTTASA